MTDEVQTATHSPNELPSVDEAVKETWTRLKERLLPLCVLSAVPLILTFIASFIGFLILVLLSKFRPDLSFNDIAYPAGVLGVLCTLVIIAVLSTWSMLALFILANHPVLLSIKDALRMTKNKIIPFWGIMLFTLIVAGSYIFFIIPGLIFSILFTFSIFTFLVENEQGMNALIKSREYIRGHFWKTVGYILIPVLLSIIFSILIALINKLTGFGASLIRLIEQIFMPAFTAVYLSIIFNRFRALKSNLTLGNTTKQKTLYLVIGLLGIAIVVFIGMGALSFLSKHPEYIRLMQMSRSMR